MFLPEIALAQGNRVNAIYNAFRSEILYPLIALAFGIALIYFLWNGWMYIRSTDSATDRPKYGKGMLYGILGLAIMTSAYAIVLMIQSTVNSIGQ